MPARTSVSWSARAPSTRPGILSGPAALCGLTLVRVLLTLAVDRDSTWLSGKGVALYSPSCVPFKQVRVHTAPGCPGL